MTIRVAVKANSLISKRMDVSEVDRAVATATRCLDVPPERTTTIRMAAMSVVMSGRSRANGSSGSRIHSGLFTFYFRVITFDDAALFWAMSRSTFQ